MLILEFGCQSGFRMESWNLALECGVATALKSLKSFLEIYYNVLYQRLLSSFWLLHLEVWHQTPCLGDTWASLMDCKEGALI